MNTGRHESPSPRPAPERVPHRRAPLLVLFLAGAAAVQPVGPARAQSHGQVHGTTLPQIAAIENAKEARTDVQEKITSQLLDTIRQSSTGHVVSAAPQLRADVPDVEPEGIIVDIKATVTQDLLDAITRLRGRVINSSARFGAVRAALPIRSIEALAARPDVRTVAAAAKAQTNQHVALEGAIMHAADRARSRFNVGGRGIKVGIISDSLDDANGSLASAYSQNALDRSQVHVLTGQAGEGSGEGLAMMEIVHAIAPEAELYFATGKGGPAQMAENILDLRDLGCDVIVDDLTYFSESPFQDDAIAQAVNEVSDDGVLYFSSARNSGSKKHGTSGTWEGDFHDGGPADRRFASAGAGARIHVFENGVTLNTADLAGPEDRVDLFWSDPIGGSSNGYDLFVVNRYGQVVRSSTTSHTGSQDPYQSVDRLRQGESIVIVKEAGAEPRFLHLDTGRARLRHSTDGNVRGHNASGAANAFSVAAMRVPSPAAPFEPVADAAVEEFSSDGPRRVFYDAGGRPLTPGNLSSSGGIVRMKPDLTAADGGSTTVAVMNPFFGTSAAAPHAAGIAALILSCAPRPTPAQVREALQGTAIGIDGSAPNANAGFGFVMAHPSAERLCAAQPGGASGGAPGN